MQEEHGQDENKNTITKECRVHGIHNKFKIEQKKTVREKKKLVYN